MRSSLCIICKRDSKILIRAVGRDQHTESSAVACVLVPQNMLLPPCLWQCGGKEGMWRGVLSSTSRSVNIHINRAEGPLLCPERNKDRQYHQSICGRLQLRSNLGYTGSAISLETHENLNSSELVKLTKKLLNIQIIY